MRNTIYITFIKHMITIIMAAVMVMFCTENVYAESLLTADPPLEVRIGRSFSVDYMFTTDADIAAVHMKLSVDEDICFKNIETSVSCYKKIYKESDGAEIIIIPDDYFITGDSLIITFTALSGVPSGEHTVSLEIIQAIDTAQNNIDLSADTFTIRTIRAGDNSSDSSKNISSANVSSSAASRLTRSSAVSSSGNTITENRRSSSVKSSSSSSRKTTSSMRSATAVTRSSRSSRLTHSSLNSSSSMDDMQDNYEYSETEHENENKRQVYYAESKENDVKMRFFTAGALFAFSIAAILYYAFMLGKRSAEEAALKKKDDFDEL